MDRLDCEKIDDSSEDRARNLKCDETKHENGSETPKVNDEELESEMKQLQERIAKTLAIIEQASERMKKIKFEREHVRLNQLQENSFETDDRESKTGEDGQSTSGTNTSIDPDIIALGNAVEEMLKQIS